MTRIFTTLSDIVPMKRGGSDKLGEGSFSKVKLVSHRSHPTKLYAMKTIPKRSEKERSLIFKEVKLHMSLDHPNIIKFEDFLEDKGEVYIFLEFAKNGDLFTQINRHKHSNDDLLRFFYQTCLAIRYIHSKNIMHRDLKPENILVDEDMNIKICDFGWSTEYLEHISRETLCGTFEYMAPEVILRQKQTKKTDIWALGILLYELFHGNAPFRGNRMDAILEQITQNRLLFRKNVDPQIKDLVVRILKFYPQDRPSIDQIFEHPLMKAMANSARNSNDSQSSNKQVLATHMKTTSVNISDGSNGQFEKQMLETQKMNFQKSTNLHKAPPSQNYMEKFNVGPSKLANAFKKNQSPSPNTVVYENSRPQLTPGESPFKVECRVNLNHPIFATHFQAPTQYNSCQKSPDPIKPNNPHTAMTFFKSPEQLPRNFNIQVQPKVYASLRNINPLFQNYNSFKPSPLNTSSHDNSVGKVQCQFAQPNLSAKNNHSSSNLLMVNNGSSDLKAKSANGPNPLVFKNYENPLISMKGFEKFDLKPRSPPKITPFKPASFVNHTLTSKNTISNHLMKTPKFEIGERTFGNYLLNISKS